MYQQSSPETIKDLFSSIATTYDKMNFFLSFGLHKLWNLKLIHTFKNSTCLLDLCAGTGEISFGFLKKNPTSKAILLDFCDDMLTIAQEKGKSLSDRFEIIQGDVHSIPLAEASVPSISISYGIRNVKDPVQCFSEIYRVLAHKGTFGILELTRPHSPLLKIGYSLYLASVFPLLGRMIAKNQEAYKYLMQSVQSFASVDVLKSALHDVGFQKIKSSPLMGGVATLITCIKMDPH